MAGSLRPEVSGRTILTSTQLIDPTGMEISTIDANGFSPELRLCFAKTTRASS
jgi:hypothetical protein